MKEIPIEYGALLAPFFQESYDSCAESFLQGIMGRGFADSETDPTYGIIQLGDFCFFGGDGSGDIKKNVVNILKSLFKERDFIFVPLSNSWYQTLSENSEFERTIRYAMDRPSLEYFNQKKLADYITRAAFDPKYVGPTSTRQFVLKPVDAFTYQTLKKEEWSKDLVGNYATFFDFVACGMGFLVLEGASGKTVSGATTFSASNEKMEIQIATKPEYEGKGLATAAAARFILECINMRKQPCWDAANLTSVHIAEKLGYHLEEEYVAFTRRK